MDISVVVPLYNEEDNVQLLYEEIKGVLDTMAEQAEIVFVDDGSRDRTLAKLEAIQAGDDHVRVVSLRRNFGQTAAMTAGFDHARGGVIITMDGDLQNDPADIPAMIDYLEANKLDVVSGWRKHRKDTFLKRFASRGAETPRWGVSGARLGESLRAHLKAHCNVL